MSRFLPCIFIITYIVSIVYNSSIYNECFRLDSTERIQKCAFTITKLVDCSFRNTYNVISKTACIMCLYLTLFTPILDINKHVFVFIHFPFHSFIVDFVFSESLAYLFLASEVQYLVDRTQS